MRYTLGATPSALQFGAKVRHEQKSFVSNAASFSATAPLTLDKVLGSYSDPSFYTTIASGFLMGPEASQGAINLSRRKRVPWRRRDARRLKRDRPHH